MKLKFELFTIKEEDHKFCHYDKCLRSSLYHEKYGGFIGQTKIKTGTICGKIILGLVAEIIYCRDCVDLVYKDFKNVFDSKLWIFK